MSDTSPSNIPPRNDEARIAFSWLVSHALNGLAHNLSGTLASLRYTTMDNPVTDEQREYIEQASASATQLIRLVEDIGLLTYAADGELDIQPEQTLLTTLVRESIAQAQTLERTQSSRLIEKHLSRKFATVWCDEPLTRRALAAIIENALRYSPADTPVDISSSKRGDWAVIRIHDQGEGVDPAIAERIFAPLWSGGRRKNSAGIGLGLGLGLAVAHACITAQGGRLKLEPARGPGATFTIELPLAPPSLNATSR